MSETPALPADDVARIGPGRLVLVVGPSGAGKDTLLGLARTACADDRDIVFPRRAVTRPASESEDNTQLSVETFRQAVSRGDFALHWQAHGHSYGVPRGIDDDIRAGRTIVVNVSRTVIAAVRGVYANVVVVSVTAPPEVLAQRLSVRARSSDGEIGLRLRRTVEEVAVTPDVIIFNIGNVEDHAQQLLRIIRND